LCKEKQETILKIRKCKIITKQAEMNNGKLFNLLSSGGLFSVESIPGSAAATRRKS
jgi:hypothetical protein